MPINLTSPLNMLGYGVVGLNAVLSLDRLGCEPALWIIGQPEFPIEQENIIRDACQRTHAYDVNAPSLRIYHQFDLAQHVGKGRQGALTYFERDKLYEHEIHHLSQQDVVVASSLWMGDVLKRNGISTDRVRYARPGVDREIFKPAPEANPAGATLFLAVGKWEVRKGHDFLVDVFNAAFTEKDNVGLILLTANPFLPIEEHNEWTSLYKNSTLGEKIQVIGPQRLPTQKHVAHVMAQADCGVFLSRAEGWNLDMAEMLAMGKHCIATNFSAHTEFARDSNCKLVHIDELEDAFDGKWFHGFGQWAHLGDSQKDQAVEHMRSIHKAKQAGKLGVNHGGLHTMGPYTWDNFAKEIVACMTT